MIRRQVRVILVAGIVSFMACWVVPVQAQDAPPEAPAVEKVQPPPPANPQAAVTAKDPTVPVDELELMLKPLTLEELQNEAAAWLLVLKSKSEEISNAEIAIKRQNLSINKQKEAADALEQSKLALKTAEEALAGAQKGSPEYEAATKKVEEAKAELIKAQEAVEEAKTAKKDLKDENLKEAVDKAKEANELDKAKTALDEAKKARESMTAGSPVYVAATKKIDTLEAAIKDLEKAQEEQKSLKPDSPEFKKAAQKIDQAQLAVKQAREAVEGEKSTADADKKAAEKLKQSEKAIDKTNLDATTSNQPGSVAKEQKNLQQKGEALEKTAEQLDANAEAEATLKNQLVSEVTKLQSDRTAIVDRFKAVLTELELKGGDPLPYQKYIDAVSAVAVDLKDTEGVGVRLLSWVQSSEGGLRWATNLGKFVAIVAVTVIVSQILAMILNRSMRQLSAGSELLRQFIVMTVKRGGLLVGVLLALTALEVSLGPILAVLGGASFVLAFALQSNLGNFASGLMIMFYKPFDLGDEVKMGDVWGFVDSITLAHTKLRNFQGHMITIPNNSVWSGSIENLTHTQKRKFVYWLRVDFGEDLRRIEEFTLDTVKAHPKVLQDPPPGTVVWSIEDYYISINVNGWTKTEDYWAVYMELLRQLRERFEQEGIGLAAIPASIYLQGDMSAGPKPITEMLTSGRLSPEDSMTKALPPEDLSDILVQAGASET